VYKVVSQWQGGFQGEVTVTNTGTAALGGWTINWTFANGQKVSNSWGGTHTQTGATVSVRNASYNGNLGPRASATFGFIGSWTGTNAGPATVTCAKS
jgi:cellulase/cellobiase CelA1